MDAISKVRARRNAVWLGPGAGDFDRFKVEVSRETLAPDWPLAAAVEKNVLIYDGDAVRNAASATEARLDLMAEWMVALDTGPGVIVIKGALPDRAVVERATAVFDDLIERQKTEGAGAGDHFAKPGANDRIWNAIEKHALADPAGFAAYYASDALAMAAEAWLGRGYQITAQVNRVNPGGAAQKPHRDYHLGFMVPEEMAAFPAHIHKVSPVLTLQGAMAHCDMPVESGPTVFLPYSQSFFEGYLAFSEPAYQDWFAAHHVQLPLEMGDAVFFNPALMHGAGENKSQDIRRMANLLQVSSAFGRAMESIDRDRMARAVYPALLEATGAGMTPRAAANVVAATAEGYAFPTNLDRDPPVGGMAPKTPATHMIEALEARRSVGDFVATLKALAEKRLA